MQAMVYFGNDLSRESILDDGIRRQALSEGVDLVRSVPGIEVLRELNTACAALVQGGEGDLQELEETLVQLGRGAMALKDRGNPPFRAAAEPR